MGYSITPLQLQALNELQCVRLSSDEGNLHDVECFANCRNPYLEDIVKGDAFEEDSKGSNAFYVVKADNGLILSYFSLKAGLLYNKHGDLEVLQSKKKLKKLLSEKDALKPSESQLKADIQVAIDDILGRLKHWMELDSEDEVHKRVAKTFPAVEIAHFCTNQNAREYWESLGFGEKNRIGVTTFWHFIVPLIEDLRRIIGLDYVFLFAADSSLDRNLVNHYISFMNFQESEEIFAALPIVDFGCSLLVNPIAGIEEARQRFYDEFNLNDEIQ